MTVSTAVDAPGTRTERPGTTRHTPAGAANGTNPDAELVPVVSPRVLQGITFALVVVSGIAAFVSGTAYVAGDRTKEIVPIVAVIAVVLAIMAATRFSGFVMLILAIRPAIDQFKLSGNPTGNTTVGNSAAAKGLDPSTTLALLFLLTGVLWLAARHYSGKRVPMSRLGLALILFVASGFVSVLGSAYLQASGIEALRIASVALMFIVLEQMIDSREMLVRVLVWCYVGLMYPLLNTVWGIALGDPNSDVKGSFTRLSGPFNQSNTYSRYLAFMIIMGVALYPFIAKRLKLLFLGVIALSSVFMLLTLTRTAIIGAFVGVVLIAVLQRRKRLLIGLGIAIVVALVLLPGVAARFATLDASTAIGGGPTGNTLAWRIRYWTEVLPLANQNPVTGIGLNVTQYQTDAAKQPHNDFIRAYVETGAFGLLAYLAMLTALVGNARRALVRATPQTLEHAVAAGALGAAAAYVLESMAANVMSNVVSLWYLFAFAACATYVARTAGDRRGGSDGPQGGDTDETAAPAPPGREDAAVVGATG